MYCALDNSLTTFATTLKSLSIEYANLILVINNSTPIINFDERHPAYRTIYCKNHYFSFGVIYNKQNNPAFLIMYVKDHIDIDEAIRSCNNLCDLKFKNIKELANNCLKVYSLETKPLINENEEEESKSDENEDKKPQLQNTKLIPNQIELTLNTPHFNDLPRWVQEIIKKINEEENQKIEKNELNKS